MIGFADLKTRLTVLVDDTSIGSANQGIFVNDGYKKVRKDIAQVRPTEFESVDTSVSMTNGIGSLPSDFMWMSEVQDADEVVLPKLKRSTLRTDQGGSTPLYYHLSARTSAAGHAKQIYIIPRVTATIHIWYITETASIDGTAGELIDLPDEEAQKIGLLYSAYLYYRSKRRWSDAANALKLYTAELGDYLDDFEDDEEEFIGESDTGTRPRFTYSN